MITAASSFGAAIVELNPAFATWLSAAVLVATMPAVSVTGPMPLFVAGSTTGLS